AERPLRRADGGVIGEAWDAALPAIVSDASEARRWIAGLEERERARTALSSLRVRFNRVFGYGIEVSHAQSGRVPADYVRRQTLTGTERYVTPELKDYEGKVLGAEERRRRLEQELFEDVRGRVAARSAPLLATARALALLDVLAALAEVAHVRDHVRPEVDEGGRGTSTFDGLAIAWAVVEDLHDRIPGAKVLFATHFHELTQLAGRLAAVRNFHVAVREWNDEIVFLHKVRAGGTDRSYGI